MVQMIKKLNNLWKTSRGTMKHALQRNAKLSLHLSPSDQLLKSVILVHICDIPDEMHYMPNELVKVEGLKPLMTHSCPKTVDWIEDEIGHESQDEQEAFNNYDLAD